MGKSLFSLFVGCILVMCSANAFARAKVTVHQNSNLQKLFSGENTKYYIKENIDLGGRTINLGKGSTLVFRGGCLSNGTVVGNGTRIDAGNYEIFKRGYTRYRAYIKKGAKDSSAPSIITEYHNWLIIKGTWNNKTCGSKWTGLLNGSREDVMPAISNFISLHANGVKVSIPRINALGYESTRLPAGHYYDFNGSTIEYPDDLMRWADSRISIPLDATPCNLESGYGLISIGDNTTIANLTIDGKSSFRQNETVRLGVSCIVAIGNAKQVVFENFHLRNVLGPGMTAQAGAKDISFHNCSFTNIGEHVMYSHQYLGFCYFTECTFDTWDSERVSLFRNGMDYVYKHTPPISQKGVSYDALYSFDLAFNKCKFINPERINAQNRKLGGFLTGTFPVVIKVNNCSFQGVAPVLNPGGGPDISEKSGKCYRMIVTNCDGAPYVYPSKANYNIITEYYDCVNIPFRTVFVKKYENCRLKLDINESNIENVSSSFESAFSEPLTVVNCDLYEGAETQKINHPVFHRSIVFEGCRFDGETDGTVSELLTIKSDRISKVVFHSCIFNNPKLVLVGGSGTIGSLSIQGCSVNKLSSFHKVQSRNIEFVDNFVSDSVLHTGDATKSSYKWGRKVKVVCRNNIGEKKQTIDNAILNRLK